MQEITINPIARIKNDFNTKFGVPRQSGLVRSLRSTIVFEPEFRNDDALRGITDFSHIWLIWQFSENVRKDWSPTVRPPRLGGNTRLGVFATRSSFRPNSLALSSVELIGIEKTEEYGTVLHVSGADLMDGTPIFDIKPYLPYSDCHPEATSGFVSNADDFLLEVQFPADLLNKVPADKQQPLMEVLSHDPRPSYQHDADRVYGLSFGGLNIRFQVTGKVLQVIDVQ